MSPVQEPVDADLDALAREPLLVAVTHGDVAAVDDDRQELGVGDAVVDLDGG